MTDYEKICSFENLYRAHVVARRGKRNRKDVIQFEMNLSENLWHLKRQLDEKKYKMDGYYSFYVHEPKKRRIYAAYYRDRVLHHCIVDEVLAPILQKKLIYDNAACQPGKGVHFAMDRFAGFMRKHYKQYGNEGYVLKCDISNYFNSINHEVLKKRLTKAVEDEDVRNLLFHIIDSFESEPGTGKGLPLGNQTSQWFALYYLDGMDRLVKEKLRLKYYSRYMDDAVMIHPSKEHLKEVLKILTTFVEDELKLEFNQKTQIFPLKNGVEYLGFRFYLTETGKVIKRMKSASKKRLKRRIKKLQKDYTNWEIDLEDVKQCLASYQGHLEHGNTYRLRQGIFQNFVLQRDWSKLDSLEENEKEG